MEILKLVLREDPPQIFGFCDNKFAL